MSLVTPHAWTAGDDATSTAMQTLTDGITQLQGGTPSGSGTALDFFRAVQSVAQTGLTISTFVSVTFSTEAIDSAGGHSTSSNTSRYVGQNAGWYQVSGCVGFAGSASGVRRIAQLALNGTAYDGSRVDEGVIGANQMTVATQTVFVQMNGTTDYVEVQGFADYASWATIISAGSSSSLHVKYLHS